MLLSRFGLLVAGLLMLAPHYVDAGVIEIDDSLATASNGGTIATTNPTAMANFAFVGNIVADNTAGTITHTADGGREQTAITTDLGLTFGRISVELNSNFGANANLFVQLIDGQSRDTGMTTLPHFAPSLNNNFSISTGPGFSTVDFFFNTTATAQTITFGGTTTTLASNTAIRVVDGVQQGTVVASSDGTPTDVDSIFFQTFPNQIGGTHVFNRVVFEDLLASVPPTVPEPSSAMLLLGAGLGLAGRRRRR